MRALTFPIFSPRQSACLALLVPLAAWAQSPALPRDAAYPDAPVAPAGPTQRCQPRPPLKRPSANAWREAHEALTRPAAAHADAPASRQQAGSSPRPRPQGTVPDAPTIAAPPAAPRPRHASAVARLAASPPHAHAPTPSREPAMTALHRISLVGAITLLAGCASVSPDGLRSDVATLTAGRTARGTTGRPARHRPPPPAHRRRYPSSAGWPNPSRRTLPCALRCSTTLACKHGWRRWVWPMPSAFRPSPCPTRT